MNARKTGKRALTGRVVGAVLVAAFAVLAGGCATPSSPGPAPNTPAPQGH